MKKKALKERIRKLELQVENLIKIDGMQQTMIKEFIDQLEEDCEASNICWGQHKAILELRINTCANEIRIEQLEARDESKNNHM